MGCGILWNGVDFKEGALLLLGFPYFPPTNRNMFACPVKYMHSKHGFTQTLCLCWKKNVSIREFPGFSCNLAFFSTASPVQFK